MNGEGGKRREERKQRCAAPPVCRFVNFLKLNHYLSLLNAFPGPRIPTSGRVYQHQHQQPLMPLVARSRALLCHSLPSSPSPSYPLSLSLSLLVPRSIHVLRLMTDSWPRKKVCKSAGTRQTEIHGSKCAAIVHTRSEGASGLTETGGGWIVEKERRTDRGSNEQNRAGRERERQRDKREEPGGARW